LLQEMENQGEILSALRQKAPQRIRENYTWEKITAQYICLFKNIGT